MTTRRLYYSVQGFFFCFSLLILFSSQLFPQSIRSDIEKIGGGKALYTWESLNLNAQVSEDGYVILSSTRTRTKATDPCSSAVRQPVSYTNWWTFIGTDTAYGISLDGTEYMEIASPSNLGISDGDMTIQWWMDARTPAGGRHLFGNLDLRYPPLATQMGWLVHFSPDLAPYNNSYFLFEMRDSSTTQHVVGTRYPLDPPEYYFYAMRHYAAVLDYSESTVSMYINGELINTSSYTPTTKTVEIASPTSFYIGTQGGGANSPVVDLGELQILKGIALNSSEILAEFQTYGTGFTNRAQAVLWYQWNDSTNFGVDLSGEGNDATLTSINGDNQITYNFGYTDKDSSQTMSKVLQNLREDTPFYWYSSLTYRTKGKTGTCAIDTFYHADAVDTFYTLIDAPTLTQVKSLSSTVIILSWLDNSSSESYYRIMRNDAAVDTVAANETTFLDDGLTPNTTYSYRVQALGTYSNSDYSNTMSVTTTCTTPETITVLSAVGDADGITLTWTDVTNDSIYIYRGLATSPVAQLTAVNNGVETYRDENVTQGLVYYYRLRAYENDCGTFGNYSATVFDTVNITDTTPPSAPTGLDAYNITRLGGGGNPVDTIPIFTPTSFTSVSNAHLDSVHTSNGMALSSFDSCWAYAAGDSFKVGIYGSIVTAYTKVFSGDTLYAIKSSSGSYSTAVTCSLTVSGVLKRFTITTIADPDIVYNVWYVDRDSPAGTSGDGISWATAWENFSETEAGGIDWSAIESGDTIYISGGTSPDSTTYYKITNSARLGFVASVSSTFNPPVIVRPSWESGHNGEVHFSSQTSPPDQNYMIVSENIHGIRFEDLNFTARTGEIMSIGGFYGNDITVYNCHFMMGDGGGGLKIDGDRWMFDSCLFERTENDYLVDTDMIGQNNDTNYTHSSTGSGIIKNSTLIYRNGYTFDYCTGVGNITITDTSLTDAGLSMTPDYHIYGSYGASVNVWHGDTLKYFQITSNTATTFYGDGWMASGVPCSAPAVACYQMEGSHRDAMQISELGRTRYQGDSTSYIVVANNLIINTNARGSGWNKMVYSYSPATAYNFFLYNNILVNLNEHSGMRNVGVETPGIPDWNGLRNCTAAENVTITANTLTDAANYFFTNRYANIGTWIRVYDSGYKYLYVTSNDNDTFTGTGGWVDIDTNVVATPPSGLFYHMMGGMSHLEEVEGLPEARASNKFKLFMFNNTIITKGDPSRANQILTCYNSDSIFVKNNLIVMDTSMLDGLYNLDNAFSYYLSDKEFDNNYYAVDDDTYQDFFGFDLYSWTLSQWQAMGRDSTSFFHPNTDVTFANKYGLNFSDYYTTAGNDSAIDLSAYELRLPPNAPPISLDAVGNPRTVGLGGDGKWDIGALEYVSGGLLRRIWKHLEPIIRDDWEQDFWKGGQK